MNHLQEAKNLLDSAKYEGVNKQVYWGIEQVDVAGVYALIAIAEQLEKLATMNVAFFNGGKTYEELMEDK